MVDQQIVAITPFAPRSEIVAHACVAGEAQRNVGVGRTVTALAIRDYFAVGIEPQALELGAQLRRRLERTRGVEVMRPVAMDRAGNRAAMARAHALAVPFFIGAYVEDLHFR